MINVLQEPKEFDFTGNGLPFEIEGDGLEVGSAIIGVFEMRLIDGEVIIDGEFFTFSNIDTGIPFILTLRASPTLQNEILLSNDMGALANSLNGNALFSAHYVASTSLISPTDYRLVIQTKEYVDIDWGNISFPIHMEYMAHIEGSVGIEAENYSIIGALSKINSDDSLTELSVFELIPDSNIRVEVMVGIILKDYFSVELPDLSSANLAEIKIDKFRIEFAEKHLVNGIMNTFSFTISKDYFVFNGKIPFETYPDFDVKTFSSVDDNFLSWANNVYYIWPGFNFYKYFLTEYNTHFYLSVKIHYTDDTTHEVQVSDIDSNTNTLVQIPCSFSKLNLDQYQPTKNIYKYELSLTYLNGSPLTKTMTFFIINKPLYARQFMFLNSFGVWEFFYTKGKRTEKLKTKRSYFKKNLSIGYVSFDFEVSSSLEEAYNIFDIETGSITRKESQNLTNMFVSKYLYEIVDNKYLRCQLIAGTTDIVPDDEDLFSVKFSYRYAFDR